MKPSLSPILGNRQRLDGGSMYGNCPRAVWSRWSPPDEMGRIPLACRAMLIRDGSRRILCETGIGAFFSPDLRERYGVVESEHVLLDELEAAGAPHETIDVVILSHLHFDHAGGLLTAWAPDSEPRLLFPNAQFIVSRGAWDRARAPHPRDRASYILPLPGLLEATGRLQIIEDEEAAQGAGVLGPGYRFHLSEGHTPGLLCTEVESEIGPVVFASDLIPGAPWMHLPITMGYDRYPERLIDEKKALLEDLESRGGSIFFTHDPELSLGRVRRDEKSRFFAEPIDT